jgi:hypothetical protein
MYVRVCVYIFTYGRGYVSICVFIYVYSWQSLWRQSGGTRTDADTCTVSLHTEANIRIGYLGTKWQKSGKLLMGVFA